MVAQENHFNVAAAVSGLDIELGKIEVNDAAGTAGAYLQKAL